MNHLGLLHYFRLICTDPRRIGLTVFRPEPLAEYQTRAPKLAWLLATLANIQAKEEKALIFCEFREIQRMLRHYIEDVFGFTLEDIAPDAGDGAFSSAVTLDDALRMEWDYFECLIAALWRKKGYKTVYRTPQHDDGVDVVAITGADGVLIQCKSCGADEAFLSWDAVKEVVAGEAAYQMRHPGVVFRKMCVTNQFFNGTAHVHAKLNTVDLLEKTHLGSLLATVPVTMLDVETLLYAEWEAA